MVHPSASSNLFPCSFLSVASCIFTRHQGIHIHQTHIILHAYLAASAYNYKDHHFYHYQCLIAVSSSTPWPAASKSSAISSTICRWCSLLLQNVHHMQIVLPIIRASLVLTSAYLPPSLEETTHLEIWHQHCWWMTIIPPMQALVS